MEGSGRKGTIEEAAWQMGEHPFVIGGGQITLGVNGETFEKGDVHKIYAEQLGATFDGDPRFGMPPYKQECFPPIDWIARGQTGSLKTYDDMMSTPFAKHQRQCTNSQGNRYNTPGGNNSSGGNSYHYSNHDGSYYYKNDNGSTYHNNGKGHTTYTAPPSGGTTSTYAKSRKPKKVDLVELMGLSAKPELNGCKGVIIESIKSGRYGVLLDDGTGVNVRPENIRICSAEEELADALAKLEAAGGKEWHRDISTPMLLPGEKYQENDDDFIQRSMKAHQYLKELLNVGDVRTKLGQYDQAGSIYYRAYHVNAPGAAINNPTCFPVAHKMIQVWLKSENKDLLKMAHSMAEQTTMMPGCPAYIRRDMKDADMALRKKGMEVTSIMDAFENIGMG